MLLDMEVQGKVFFDTQASKNNYISKEIVFALKQMHNCGTVELWNNSGYFYLNVAST